MIANRIATETIVAVRTRMRGQAAAIITLMQVDDDGDEYARRPSTLLPLSPYQACERTTHS